MGDRPRFFMCEEIGIDAGCLAMMVEGRWLGMAFETCVNHPELLRLM